MQLYRDNASLNIDEFHFTALELGLTLHPVVTPLSDARDSGIQYGQQYQICFALRAISSPSHDRF